MKLFDIYSPSGEKFEVSKPNFDDLRKHYSFTPNPPETSTVAIATVIKDETTDGEDSSAVHQERSSEEGERSAAEAGSSTTESTAVPTEAGSEESTSEEEVSEKTALQNALKERHDFDADKRWNVVKLAAKLAELDEAASA